MFSKIITLSLNPAIDITMWTDTLTIGEDNHVQGEQYDAAGKAMNVSRALRYYGLDSFALVLAGRHNLYRYEQRLASENVNYKIIPVDGYIRENISIVLPDRSVTRLMREGFCVEYESVEEIKAQLTEVVTPGSLVVIAGSLPKGISPTVFKMICRHINLLDARIALDVSSLSVEDLIDIKPWVIKPNYNEACQLAGETMTTQEAVVELGKRLNRGGVENCIISLGKEGLIHTCMDSATRVDVPAVDVISSVGAGDCTLAGFIMSVQQEAPLGRCLRTAAAFGTAACLTEGTNPPPKLATANIMQKVALREIEAEKSTETA